NSVMAIRKNVIPVSMSVSMRLIRCRFMSTRRASARSLFTLLRLSFNALGAVLDVAQVRGEGLPLVKQIHKAGPQDRTINLDGYDCPGLQRHGFKSSIGVW